jgi:hypothetical protein
VFHELRHHATVRRSVAGRFTKLSQVESWLFSADDRAESHVFCGLFHNQIDRTDSKSMMRLIVLKEIEVNVCSDCKTD